jgi:hypothetical protein
MAMGKRKDERQQELFVAADTLRSAGHPFSRKLNQLLAAAGFEAFVEAACLPYYKDSKTGRPSVAPGVYFRMLFVGYFEGIHSQRGLDGRCADRLALREFLGIPLGEAMPDHSTLSVTRERLPPEVHDSVFEFVLSADSGYHKDATAAQKQATLANRRRLERPKGRRLQRRRSEAVERTFAHLCKTGGTRRTWLRGIEKVPKRYLMHAAAPTRACIPRGPCERAASTSEGSGRSGKD